MSLAQFLRTLGARFDTQALLPPAAAPGAITLLQHHAQLQDQLQAWCWQGAGPGTTAWWQPGARPAVGQRLVVAALCGATGASTKLPDWANTFARQLDGSTQLDNLPNKWSGLQLRLTTKLQDAQWWRPRQPADPWDAGWAINTPTARQQLQHHFLPRRATLILADSQAAAALRPCLVGLAQRSHTFHQPVRWLWVGSDDNLAATQGPLAARFTLVGATET